jgi:transposase-like protein
LADEYRAFGGKPGAISELAALHGCHRTQIWRWLKQARERGCLPAEQPGRVTA